MIMSNMSNNCHTDSGGVSKSSYYSISWASQPIKPFSIRFSLKNLSVLTHSDNVNPTKVRDATQVEKAFTRELNGHIYFNSEHSPLSSFYPAEINYGNEKYCHNEQAYQHQRAVTVGNVDIAKQIKVETDPRKCKSLGHQLPNSQTWDNKKEEVMKDLIQIKAQIPEIKDKLSKTGELSLVECTADSYWACGASFRSQKVQTGKTTGQNKLGHIWMETRRNQRQEMNGNNDMPPLEDPK